MTDALPLRTGLHNRTAAPEASILAPGRRPVLYDMTHLIARLRTHTGTGIDRIDLAFASHFFSGAQHGQAVRYGATSPRLIRSGWARQFARAAERVWTEAESARADALGAWLEPSSGIPERPDMPAPTPHDPPAWGRRLLSWAGYLSGSARRSVPQGAIYINVGYHRFEHPRFFAWLAKRPDVDAVFMIHDLLPLDYPEFFESGEAQKFRERIATALRYGRAFLVSTEAVRRRLLAEFAARGLPPRPIWAHPFPSPLADVGNELAPRLAPKSPYFVAVGTIEPRKNHLLLLQIWRQFARRMAAPPKLVLVGKRGWENEQVLDLLDRCEVLRPHVAEVSNLGSRQLAELMAGARAVLAPSFDEGYGLPVVEALALGVPVVASDNDAAREVSQGRARLLSPIDGEGWSHEILRLATDDAHRAEACARAAGFVAPNWRDYFASLDRFLDDLSVQRA